MQDLGKLLLVGGAVLAVVGLALLFAPKIPWLGKLPGDIFVKKGNFTFYFPVVTCIVISIVISLLMRFFKK